MMASTSTTSSTSGDKKKDNKISNKSSSGTDDVPEVNSSTGGTGGNNKVANELNRGQQQPTLASEKGRDDGSDVGTGIDTKTSNQQTASSNEDGKRDLEEVKLDDNVETPAPPKMKKPEAMEIDDGTEQDTEDDEYLDESFDDDEDDDINDLEQLLGEGGEREEIQQSKKRRKNKKLKAKEAKSMVTLAKSYILQRCCCCCKPCCNNEIETIGNMRVIFPETFFQTGWGVLGPHYFGPLCVIVLVTTCSSFFIHRSILKIGPFTTLTCIIFTLVTIYNLIDASFRDPGIVAFQPPPENVNGQVPRGYRWCDFCKLYQPPDGAHCPDCNVCVAGYDHHCVWMGTCIGKNNFKQFVRFNLSWLFYLAYAIVWISFIAPVLYHE